MTDKKPAPKKGRPTFEAQLNGLGFADVAIERDNGIKTLRATFDGKPVTIRAYPDDNMIEIAKGWVEHQS